MKFQVGQKVTISDDKKWFSKKVREVVSVEDDVLVTKTVGEETTHTFKVILMTSAHTAFENQYEYQPKEKEQKRVVQVVPFVPTCPVVNIKSRKMLPKFSDEELTVLAQRIGLTLDQLKRYGDAAYRTYNAIGADLAECNGGKGMKRYDVVEVTLDADHISVYGQLDTDLIEWRKTRSHQAYKLEDYYGAVAAVSFPYPEYE